MKTVLFLFIFSIMSSCLFAQQRGNRNENRKPGNKEEMIQKRIEHLDEMLDLSDAQEKQMKILFIKQHDDISAAKDKTGTDRNQAMKEIREKYNQELKKILTPGQYEKYRAYREKQQKKRASQK